MTRFIAPVILIGISVAVFLLFTNPIYNEISALKSQVGSYDDALNNSKALENERDKLTAKYNTIDKADLAKLEKLLPENVDNIRLILELEKIITPYGMVLKDVKYNTTDTSATPANGVGQRAIANKQTPKDYGVFELQFSTSGTYDNFINFTKNLENNLRIVDIASINFSSSATTAGLLSKKDATEIYKYDFKIRTYWLKN
ncbi:MAG: hypothetical protein WCT44_03045 [Candidatus Paceibacterota bacterium]